MNKEQERSARAKAELEKIIQAAQQVAADGPGRKPTALANMPRVQRYVMEKAVGVRRENGAVKLTRLTNRHYRIIGLHLEGKSLEEISSTLHVSFSTISRVVNDPLAQGILRKVYTHREEEIQSLAGRALQATRDALKEDQPIGVKLRGVDRFIKMREAMLSKDTGRESAEDVVARILSQANFVNSNVQINVGDTSASTK